MSGRDWRVTMAGLSERGAYLDQEEHWRETRRQLGAEDGLARGEWERVNAWWREAVQRCDDRGLTHADMNATNAVWDGQRVRLIDFDEPIWHVFASDLARPFREMGSHAPSLREAARLALFEGYRSERALEPEWEEALPWLVRMKQLEIYASAVRMPGWQGSMVGPGTRREDFIAERRRAFESDARER